MEKRKRLSVLIAVFFLSSACALIPGGSSDVQESPDTVVESQEENSEEVSQQGSSTLGEVQRVEEGGFSFQVIPDYELEIYGGMVTMTAPGADAETGPVVQLIGWADGVEKTNDQLLDELISNSDMQAGEPSEKQIAGVSGLEVEITGDTAGVAMQGTVLVVSADGQQFVLMAAAPLAEWTDLAPIYEEVLASVEFFTASSGSTSLSQESGMTAYTNMNVVRDVIVHEGIAYTATLGGMVAWNLQSGYPMQYTTQEGMGHVSSNAITLCDLPETRVVVGTQKGLSLYDPSTGLWEDQTLLPADHEFTNSKITALYCDQANNRLLIGARGLLVLDLASGEIQHYTTDGGLAWNEVRDITVSGSSIWAASGYRGVAMISNGTVTTYTSENGLPDDRVTSVEVAGDGTLWAGASSGLMSFRAGSWTLFGSDTPARLASVSEVDISADGKIWAATSPLGAGRLCQFNPADGSCVIEYTEMESQPVLALDMYGELPVYGTSRGLYTLDNVSASLYLTADQLASNYVDSFAVTPDEQLWVGTDGGIQFVDTWNMEGSWTSFTRLNTQGLGGNWASDIALGPDGVAWVAVINGEASRYQDGSWTSFEDIYSFNEVAVDGEGRAWFGDDNKGIVVLNADGTPAMTLTSADGLPGDRVNALLSDSSGTIWIGTDQGVLKYETGQLITVVAADDPQLPNRIIRDLAWAPDGTLLIGTFTGLSRLDGSQAELLVDFLKDGFSQARLTTLAASPSGTVYMGTDRGLMYSDDLVEWTVLTTDDGLLTDYISALLVDDTGTVWIGGGGSNFDGGGILRFVP